MYSFCEENHFSACDCQSMGKQHWQLQMEGIWLSAYRGNQSPSTIDCNCITWTHSTPADYEMLYTTYVLWRRGHYDHHHWQICNSNGSLKSAIKPKHSCRTRRHITVLTLNCHHLHFFFVWFVIKCNYRQNGWVATCFLRIRAWRCCCRRTRCFRLDLWFVFNFFVGLLNVIKTGETIYVGRCHDGGDLIPGKVRFFVGLIC